VPRTTFLEALEGLRRAVAWMVQTENAAAQTGSEALWKIHQQARDEVVRAAEKLVCVTPDASKTGE
jgi:hypothetical protein